MQTNLNGVWLTELRSGRRATIAGKPLFSRPGHGAHDARFHVNLSDAMTVPFDHE